MTPTPTKRDVARLKAFALAVLDGYRTGEVGDIDGWWLQDKACELGLLVESGAEDDPNYHLAPFLKRKRTSR